MYHAKASTMSRLAGIAIRRMSIALLQNAKFRPPRTGDRNGKGWFVCVSRHNPRAQCRRGRLHSCIVPFSHNRGAVWLRTVRTQAAGRATFRNTSLAARQPQRAHGVVGTDCFTGFFRRSPLPLCLAAPLGLPALRFPHQSPARMPALVVRGGCARRAPATAA